MANRFPLVIDSSALQIKEIPANDNLDLANNSIVNVVNITASGNVSVGGTLTYEDVTNIDSVGLITARSGINVSAGGIEVTSGICTFLGGLVEKFEDAGTTLALQTNNPLSDGNVILFTGDESGNTTINFTGVHSSLAQGENVSFTVIISPNGSGVINTVQVDGIAQTIQWSGGAAPTAGASGRDVYTFTLLKNGITTTSYLVFGAATNYA